MIENAHDPGFAMCRHGHGMKTMLVLVLQIAHLFHHIIRQALGNKISNNHRVGILPLRVLQIFNNGAETARHIGAAAKTLA